MSFRLMYVYIPNPLRCFNCQRFGHHENNCTEDPGSVCENCGADGHAHHTSQCKNPTKCINCGKGHSPKSNTCETWLKEKAIMKLKVTNNINYFKAEKNARKSTRNNILENCTIHCSTRNERCVNIIQNERF